MTLGGQVRIAGLIGKEFHVPEPKDPSLKKEYFLELGYQDEPGDYGDNGYWGHDNGNNDECLGVGPEWVMVSVKSGDVRKGVELSPYSRPFDLVWDINNEDYNGLPLNPKWAFQLSHPGDVPDFKAICGSAIILGGTIIPAALAKDCTSQAPTTDLDTSPFLGLFGICEGLLNGHLNWGVATYTGLVNWQDWESDSAWDNFWRKDGDYNMGMFPPDKAGQTTQESSLGLEFNDDETVHAAGGPWWRQLRNGAENGGQPTPTAMMGSSGGIPGVVTGLIGVDGVHDGGYTESHPVFSIALNTNETPVKDGVQQTWVFFLRNFGNEGGCSEGIHTWPSSLNNDEYFVQLPWPDGAKDARVVGKSEWWKWQDQDTSGSIVTSADPGWTLIKVKLPPNGQFGIDGQFTIEYSFAPDHKSESRKHTDLGTEKDEEADSVDLPKVISQIKDPAERNQFTQDVQALKPLSVRPPMKRVQMTFDTTMRVEPRHPGEASRGRLTRAQSHPDPVKHGLDDGMKKLKDKYGSQLQSIRPATK